MSDPKDIPGRTRPPWAEPLQPDKSGRGDGRVDPEASGTGDDADRAERQRRQSDTALDNVRKGYD